MGRDLAHQVSNVKAAEQLSQKPGLIQAAVQKEGYLVIPGSSLKGVVRSIYESITESCLCKISRKPKLHIEPSFSECSANNTKGVCPACRIFGAMGYLGLVRFEDAVRDRRGFQLFHVPPLNSPNLNAQDEGEFIYFDLEKTVNSQEDKKQMPPKPRLRGRKVYPHSLEQIPAGITVQGAKVGSQFRTAIRFANITETELGALLIALGLDSKNPFVLKMGGGKAVGKGSVEVTLLGVEKAEYADIESRYQQYSLPGSKELEGQQLNAFVEKAIVKARPASQNSSKPSKNRLVMKNQLEQVHQFLEWPSEDSLGDGV